MIVLAVIGAAAGWRRLPEASSEATFWARYLACDVAIAGAIFSLIPYKTPWNVLPFYVVAFALAGVGFATLVGLARSGVMRSVLAAALALASFQLGWQAWRAAVTYAADPRNPYVYAQTVPDAVRMASRIRELCGASRRRNAHAGIGDCAAVRAVAAPVVSPDDAERRVLDGAR